MVCYYSVKCHMNDTDLKNQAVAWTTTKTPPQIPDEWYCVTRDVFEARLQTVFLSHLEKAIGIDAYLLTSDKLF